MYTYTPSADGVERGSAAHGGAAVPENGGGSEERGGAAEERVGAAEETASRSGHSGADQTQKRGTCTAPEIFVVTS